MLRRGQRVEGLGADAGDVMALAAGEMSMHHTMALHCSGPNRTSEPRVGVVLVFLPPSTIPQNKIGSATLVAGKCDAEHWELSSFRPDADAGAAASNDRSALAAHAQALARHRGELRAKA